MRNRSGQKQLTIATTYFSQMFPSPTNTITQALSLGVSLGWVEVNVEFIIEASIVVIKIEICFINCVDILERVVLRG